MREESLTVAQRLARHGAPLTTHFYRGTHDPAYWSRELHATLPWLLHHLR